VQAAARVSERATQNAACGLTAAEAGASLTTLALQPDRPLADYRAAMRLADAEARRRLG